MKKKAIKIGMTVVACMLLGCLLSGCIVREKVGDLWNLIEDKAGFNAEKVDLFFSYYTESEKADYTAAATKEGKTGLVIAIGGGFDTEGDFKPLLNRCIKHVNKDNPKMLFVPTAHKDELEENEEIIKWFENAGCESDVLLVSKATKEEVKTKVAWADIIYETGGNLKFLTENWEEKGMYKEVKKAFDRGAALIGPSSGAMCWAEKGWDDCGEEKFRVIDHFPFLGKDAAYSYFDCAGILPFCVCPHFDNIAWGVYGFKALGQDFPSLCIENGAAVVYCGGEYEVVSDEATPKRRAYLFYWDRKFIMEDVKAHPEFLTYVTGERKS